MSSTITAFANTAARRTYIELRGFAPNGLIELWRDDANGRRLVRLARGRKYDAQGAASLFDYEAALTGSVTYSATGTRTNELANPSFEVDTTGWFAGSGDVIARVTTPKFSGVAALQITTDGAQAAAGSPMVPGVTPGDPWSTSAYLRSPGGGQGYVRLNWYDAANASVGENVGGQIALDDTWRRAAVTATAPATAAKARVYALVDKAGPILCYADAVLLERTADTWAPYLAGSAAATITSVPVSLDLAERPPGAYVHQAAAPQTGAALAILEPGALETWRATRELGAQLHWPKGRPDPIDTGSVARVRAVTMDFRLPDLATARQLEALAAARRALVVRHHGVAGLDGVVIVTDLDGPWPDPQDAALWHVIARGYETTTGPYLESSSA